MNTRFKSFWKLVLGLLFLYLLFLFFTNFFLFFSLLTPKQIEPLPPEEISLPPLPASQEPLPVNDSILDSSPAAPLLKSTNITHLQNATLPNPTAYFSCIESSAPYKIYCFGGYLGPTTTFRTISEYDLQRKSDRILNIEMPYVVDYLSCVDSSITHNVYCFGGRDGSTFHPDIVMYNPRQQIVTKKTDMPSGRAHFSCTESSATHKIYCFGGGGSGSLLDEILAYDPLLNSVKIMKTRLPTPRYQVSCADSSLTKKIYCFGGAENSVTGQAQRIDKIIAYDPTTDTFSTMQARLPTPRRLLSCLEDPSSHEIYCFGGDDAEKIFYDDILRYDPATDSIEVVSHLPSPRTGLSCAKDSQSSSFYCFGGIDKNGLLLDDIFSYTPKKAA